MILYGPTLFSAIFFRIFYSGMDRFQSSLGLDGCMFMLPCCRFAQLNCFFRTLADADTARDAFGGIDFMSFLRLTGDCIYGAGLFANGAAVACIGNESAVGFLLCDDDIIWALTSAQAALFAFLMVDYSQSILYGYCIIRAGSFAYAAGDASYLAHFSYGGSLIT